MLTRRKSLRTTFYTSAINPIVMSYVFSPHSHSQSHPVAVTNSNLINEKELEMNKTKSNKPLIAPSIECQLLLNILAHDDLDEEAIAALSRHVLTMNHAHITKRNSKHEQ